MKNPDYCYNPDDWEVTYDWGDRNVMVDDLDLEDGEIKRVSCLAQLPDKFVARVPVGFDEDGEPEDRETEWFDSEEAARTAMAKRP